MTALPCTVPSFCTFALNENCLLTRLPSASSTRMVPWPAADGPAGGATAEVCCSIPLRARTETTSIDKTGNVSFLVIVTSLFCLVRNDAARTAHTTFLKSGAGCLSQRLSATTGCVGWGEGSALLSGSRELVTNVGE